MLLIPRKIIRLACYGIVLPLLAACGSSGPLVADQLDPVTGVTVTRATKPLVLYRDRSALAAHARDYVYLGPVEVNNMGRRDYYLWLGIWGMSDTQDRAETLDSFESVVIYADGEPFYLDVEGWTLESIGVTETVYVKPLASAIDAFYRVTIDQIRVIAAARDVELRAGATRPHRYTPWDTSASRMDGMIAFVRHVN